MTTDSKTLLANLFDSHSPGLVRFLSKKLKSREDAEDIAQNAFIRIEKVVSSENLENIKGYLYQTASNLAIDKLRREKLHNKYINQETSRYAGSEDFLQGPVDECSPDKHLDAQRQLHLITEALDKLPPKCKRAFLLHRQKGLSYSEIAAEMSVSVSSVEKYILRALKEFRQALQTEDTL